MSGGGATSRARLSIDSTVAASGEQISSEVGGEAVILDLKGGVYFGLDPIGTRIWALMQRPIAVSAIRDALTAEYAVEAERCERDVLALLEQLAARGLITVRDDAPSP